MTHIDVEPFADWIKAVPKAQVAKHGDKGEPGYPHKPRGRKRFKHPRPEMSLDTVEIWDQGPPDEDHPGLDPEVRAEIERVLTFYQRKYGMAVIVDVRPGNNAERSVAQALGIKITLNPKVNDPEWRATHIDKRGYILADNIGEAMVHEFGHLLAGRLVEDDQAASDALHAPFIDAQNYDKWGSATRSLEWDDERNTWAHPNDGSWADLQGHVSMYAGENASEAIAEAFLQWERGSGALATAKPERNKWNELVGAAFARYDRFR